MEVECRSMSNAQCRWLLGSAEAMQAVYAAMTEGAPYLDAVGRLS